MILADTSVWIDHLSRKDDAFALLLNDSQIMTHPFVIGEIALGNLKNRTEILSKIQKLPMMLATSDSEILFFITQRQLAGRGVGYIDVHLLAATAMTPPARLWTRDKKLLAVATSLGLAYKVN